MGQAMPKAESTNECPDRCALIMARSPKQRRSFSAIASLLFVLALAACAAPAPDQAELDAETVAEVQRIQAEEDERILSSAEADLEYSRYELALERLSGLAEPVVNTPRARYALAEANLGVGNTGNAYMLYQTLLDDGTYRARALQGIGLAELALGREDAAGAALQEAVQGDATLWRAWNALGRYYDNLSDWPAAEAAYAKALTLQPDDPAILNNLGISYSRQSRYAEAEGMYRQALAIDPSSMATENNLRLAIAWQGRYAEALNGVPSAEAPDALNNVGYIAMMNGDYATAERLFVSALDVSPTYHAEAQSNLDRLRALQGAPGVSQPTDADE
jgi:Flp pilus assembly protein TadD